MYGTYIHETIHSTNKHMTTHTMLQESILAEPGGLPRMRNFRQKWEQSLRWEVDDRGGEFFDASFMEVVLVSRLCIRFLFPQVFVCR